MKILVVDDESYAKEALARFVVRFGHTALEAENGLTAVSLYKEQKPDLVFLDINLPDIKGYEVFKRIKEFDKDALIYFFTGEHVEYMKIKELNPAGYFMKPLMLPEIKKIIDETKKMLDAKGKKVV